MQCARCYQQNRQGRRFCSECGVLAGTCLPILRLLEWGTFGYPNLRPPSTSPESYIPGI